MGSKGFRVLESEHGVQDVICRTWSGFLNYMDDRHTSTHGIIWRGIWDASFELVPSMYRWMEKSEIVGPLLSPDNPIGVHALLEEPVGSLKASLKRTLVSHLGSEEVLSWPDERLLAYAQHHGASTPVMDWTKSPYVASFFAFSDVVANVGLKPKRRGEVAVYGLVEHALTGCIDKWNKTKGRTRLRFKVFRDLLPGNQRVIAQQGILSYVSPTLPIVTLVQHVSSMEKHHKNPILIRVRMPYTIVEHALTHLNRMNVSYFTLFPDPWGACRHASMNAILLNYEGDNIGREPMIKGYDPPDDKN